MPQQGSVSLWDLVRVINMLILIKLLRVITTQFKAMYIVTSTIYDLIRNLKAFAGLLAVRRHQTRITQVRNSVTIQDVPVLLS